MRINDNQWEGVNEDERSDLLLTQTGTTGGGLDTFSAVVLNAVGCNTGAAGSPVAAGSTSPVTVRLIHTP